MKKPPKVKENGPMLWRIPPLQVADHKYTRGHVLVLGGAEMTGAARLSALAAQRAGAGLVSIATTPASFAIYASAMLSVMVRACGAPEWRRLLADDRINPVIIGPGAGVNARTRSAMMAAFAADKKLILDADALSMLASDAVLRQRLIDSECDVILTPHEGEYARLAKSLKLDPHASHEQCATLLAAALGCVVVFKGNETMIADANGRVVKNVSNAPWLATGGTGDVLAGIIGGLVAQGMGGFDAACAGVWLHAVAARTYGHGMIAEDVIAALPALFKNLH